MTTREMTDAVGYVSRTLEESMEVMRRIPVPEVARLIELLSRAREERRQIFLCGNGGSAATASHFANDLGKGASLGRPRRFRVLSLTDNISWISALANDLDYSRVFVEQLENYAQPEDVLMAFSGSGNSPSVLEAVSWANHHGLHTVGLTGRPGGKLGQLAGLPIFIESPHMGRIEEGHFLIQHLVGYYFVDEQTTNDKRTNDKR